MRYQVIKIMDMGRGENHYRVMGEYKTIKGAQRCIQKNREIYPQSSVTFRIDEI